MEPVQPVAIGLFQDVHPDPCYYETIDGPVVATKEVIQEHIGLKDDGKIHICATHLPPSQVEGPKVIMIRDPREVIVSYSHWWMKTTSRTEDERQEFMRDWVYHSAQSVKKKWDANISKYGWTEWHLGVNPGVNVIRFEDITPLNLHYTLKHYGIETDWHGPKLSFDLLRAGDPYMYRRGEKCLDEFPDYLEPEAARRWGPMIERFWT
jgi:hypothetical protein